MRALFFPSVGYQERYKRKNCQGPWKIGGRSFPSKQGWERDSRKKKNKSKEAGEVRACLRTNNSLWLWDQESEHITQCSTRFISEVTHFSALSHQLLPERRADPSLPTAGDSTSCIPTRLNRINSFILILLRVFSISSYKFSVLWRQAFDKLSLKPIIKIVILLRSIRSKNHYSSRWSRGDMGRAEYCLAQNTQQKSRHSGEAWNGKETFESKDWTLQNSAWLIT